MADASAKLREAKFFLELLKTLENKGAPLTVNIPICDEIAFILSGALNALYSATEHLKSNAGVVAIKEFKLRYPLIFDGKNGLRSLTVHERHISPSPVNYVPPKGNAVRLVFSEPATQSASLVFRSQYYVEVDSDQLHIVSFVQDHYTALSELASQYGVTAKM